MTSLPEPADPRPPRLVRAMRWLGLALLAAAALWLAGSFLLLPVVPAVAGG